MRNIKEYAFRFPENPKAWFFTHTTHAIMFSPSSPKSLPRTIMPHRSDRLLRISRNGLGRLFHYERNDVHAWKVDLPFSPFFYEEQNYSLKEIAQLFSPFLSPSGEQNEGSGLYEIVHIAMPCVRAMLKTKKQHALRKPCISDFLSSLFYWKNQGHALRKCRLWLFHNSCSVQDEETMPLGFFSLFFSWNKNDVH